MSSASAAIPKLNAAAPTKATRSLLRVIRTLPRHVASSMIVGRACYNQMTENPGNLSVRYVGLTFRTSEARTPHESSVCAASHADAPFCQAQQLDFCAAATVAP